MRQSKKMKQGDGSRDLNRKRLFLTKAVLCSSVIDLELLKAEGIVLVESKDQNVRIQPYPKLLGTNIGNFKFFFVSLRGYGLLRLNIWELTSDNTCSLVYLSRLVRLLHRRIGRRRASRKTRFGDCSFPKIGA